MSDVITCRMSPEYGVVGGGSRPRGQGPHLGPTVPRHPLLQGEQRGLDPLLGPLEHRLPRVPDVN